MERAPAHVEAGELCGRAGMCACACEKARGMNFDESEGGGRGEIRSSHARARTHTCTHARTHARTHGRTLPYQPVSAGACKSTRVPLTGKITRGLQTHGDTRTHGHMDTGTRTEGQRDRGTEGHRGAQGTRTLLEKFLGSRSPAEGGGGAESGEGIPASAARRRHGLSPPSTRTTGRLSRRICSVEQAGRLATPGRQGREPVSGRHVTEFGLSRDRVQDVSSACHVTEFGLSRDRVQPARRGRAHRGCCRG